MTNDVADLRKSLSQKQQDLRLSDSAFASKLGISRQLWNFIKNGTRKPGMKFYSAVMRVFPEFTTDVMVAMKERGSR